MKKNATLFFNKNNAEKESHHFFIILQKLKTEMFFLLFKPVLSVSKMDLLMLQAWANTIELI
ncbi:MAG: hypothetical protein A2309_00285 [Bacteroidetes bacterium RIFOXYB2_FULL_35_7]|nr:MAG: hypothetical protein A2309_00285 [Bacteroidetes bacterium RIFOXYB2_FULL_35_7]HBX49450.1 hypothetical protein [Bacteroidales bacterium]